MRTLIILACIFAFSNLMAEEVALKIKLGDNIEEIYFIDGTSAFNLAKDTIVDLGNIDIIYLKNGDMITPELAMNDFAHGDKSLISMIGDYTSAGGPISDRIRQGGDDGGAGSGGGGG